MPLATAIAAQVLNKLFGTTNFTPDVTYYVGLRSGGTELSGSGYARVAVTNNTTNFPNIATNLMVNGVRITFPQASADWATVDEVAIYTASSGGLLRFTGTPDSSFTVRAGQTRYFDPGDLKIKLIPAI